jgi:hypothetical protein
MNDEEYEGEQKDPRVPVLMCDCCNMCKKHCYCGSNTFTEQLPLYPNWPDCSQCDIGE